MTNQERAESAADVVSTDSRARIASEVFISFPQDGTSILDLLEPFLEWKLEFAAPTPETRNLACHAISDLMGDQDEPIFMSVSEWRSRGLACSQREVKRLEAVEEEYYEKLDAMTKDTRERANPKHAHELFEWLGRPFQRIVQCREFARFSTDMRQNLNSQLGLHGREVFEQLERLMLLPAMLHHAGLPAEVARFVPRRKLLLAGNPLVGMQHNNPVILVKD